MGLEQTGRCGGILHSSVVLTAAAIILLPILVSSQNKKNLPPPRPAPVRPQATGVKPNQGRPPSLRPAPARARVPPATRPVTSVSPPPAPNKPFSINNPRTPSVNRAPAGNTLSLKSGGTANLKPNGQLRSIDRNGTHIEYAGHGVRSITSDRNGAHVVTTGAHQGYVQRPFVSNNGHTYVQRTYVVNHVTRTVAYRSYEFHGAHYYGYASSVYFHPVFYSWAYNPWPAPIFWSWGWSPAAYPWYGYYGSYFAPYPVYRSAAFWLTDYLVADDLQAAYAAQAASAATANNYAGVPAQQYQSGAAPGQQTAAMSPQVKQAIAEEVKAELAAEQAAASQGRASTGTVAQTMSPDGDIPPALDPALRTFVVASSLDVVGSDQECTLTPGDVITRLTDTPDQDQKVTVSVSSSKKADCAAGKPVLVSVQDLQEMQNHFREQLDSGLRVLAAKQGTGGLPKAPDTTLVGGEVAPPVVDASAEQALQQQEAAADQAERDVSQYGGTNGPS